MLRNPQDLTKAHNLKHSDLLYDQRFNQWHPLQIRNLCIKISKNELQKGKNTHHTKNKPDFHFFHI